MMSTTANNPYMPKHTPDSPLKLASWAAYLADCKKCNEITVLKTEGITSIADYFVIASGQSRTQVRATVDDIETLFGDAGFPAKNDERDQQHSWCLLDYGDIIVHVMQDEQREFYRLEQFWNHAEPVEKEAWLAVAHNELGLEPFGTP
jgi:ribosome-associated protein